MTNSKFYIISLLVSTIMASSMVTIDQDRQFRDANGRHILFHGVNVVYKEAPFIPNREEFSIDASLNDEDIDDLQKWGINFVRLGITWESVERSEGVYNETYL